MSSTATRSSVKPRTLATWAYRLLFASARYLPRRLATLCAWALGWLGWWLDAPGRARTARNLRPLLTRPCSRPALARMVRRTYITFVCTVLDHARMDRLPAALFRPPLCSIHDPFGYLPHMARQPTIFVANHCQWELNSAVLFHNGFLQQWAAIALSHQDPRIDALFARARQGVGCQTLLLDGAPLAALRWLRAGNHLGIIADRQYTQHGLAVRMGNGRTNFPIGPAALAVQTAYPVVPILCARVSPERYRFLVARPLYANLQLPKGEQIPALTQALADVFTRFAQAVPSQWNAFADIWLPESA